MNRRRNEAPTRRINPSGKVVWVARYTTAEGSRRSNGSYDKKGPCKLERDGCCAQHAIWAAYAAEDSPQAEAVTFGAYSRTWLRVHPRPKRTATGYASYLRAVRPVVLEGTALADWPLGDLRRRHIRLLLHELLVTQGRAAKGAKNILLGMSAMFNDAIEDEVCAANPCLGVTVRAGDPRVQKPPRPARVVSWEDMHRLAAASGEHEPMLRLLSDCGLRLSELLGLQAEDVKLSGCQECRDVEPHLHVRQTAHGGVVEPGTKRERLRNRLEGGRVVPLPPVVTGLLRRLPPRIAGPMWFTPDGAVWPQKSFYREVWDPARAKTVDVTPQDFRHSWVSELRAAGVDPADLAQMAGHSVQMASAVYTHALGRSFDVVRKVVGE